MAFTYVHALGVAVIVFFGILLSYQRGAMSRPLLTDLEKANQTIESLLKTMATIERQRDEALAGWRQCQDGRP